MFFYEKPFKFKLSQACVGESDICHPELPAYMHCKPLKHHQNLQQRTFSACVIPLGNKMEMGISSESPVDTHNTNPCCILKCQERYLI